MREFEVFDLPYIFDNYDELHKVTGGPVGKALFKKLEIEGHRRARLLGQRLQGHELQQAAASCPADVKGLKMRIQSSKVLEAQMKALGALPQMMAFSEVYQALQTGVVDGTENPPSNLYTQKMHEVQKHAIVSDHGYLGYAVITNKKFWDGLPADVRAGLEAAMDEATVYANTIAKQENDEALEKVKAVAARRRSTCRPRRRRRRWKKALVPVHKEMESRIGKDTIQAVYTETGFKPD